jgi:hypothetical protein
MSVANKSDRSELGALSKVIQCSQDSSLMGFLGNSPQKVQYLLLEKAFSCNNPQISSQLRVAFSEVRQLNLDYSRRWFRDLNGPLSLRVHPPSKSDDFVAMYSQISIKPSIRTTKRPNGTTMAEAAVNTPEDIRY